MKERLKELLIENRLNAKELALRIGVQPSSISHILTGRNKPSIEILEKLLNSFPDIDIKYLITGNKSLVSRGIPEMEMMNSGNEKAVEMKNGNEPEVDLSTIVTSNEKTLKIILLRSDGTFLEFAPG